MGSGGLVCFVHRAWPGEVLWARVTKVKKRFVHAVKTETVELHNHPATPPCPHFGPCSGCALQSVAYDSQLAWKRRWVVDSLRRIAGSGDEAEALVRPTVGCGDLIYKYRNKMEFSFSVTEWTPADGALHDDTSLQGRWALGKHRPGHHDQVLTINSCSLQSDAMNRCDSQIFVFTRCP
jgi:tRNA/tmRNA/rRNA uracil-C5-methylase (TrmA/RlmC/RlmD family)